MEDPPAAADAVKPLLPQAEEDLRSGTEKRPIQEGEDRELAFRSGKKARRCGPGEMRRVAEIVLVLSAMAQMRSGRSPTPTEAELMVEARAKMAEVCQDLAPKDIVSREAVGSVIEDLGLNAKAKDLRLGFRGPRLTIAERMAHTKKKIEDSKKFTAHPATYSSQTSFGAAADNRGMQQPVRMFASDKQVHTPIPSGNFPASSPIGHVSAAPSASLPHQLPSNEVRAPIVSSGLPSSNLGRDSSSTALPRVERAQLKVDGGPNGTSYASQVRVNSSADRPLVNAPTWSVHPQSAASAKTGPDIKVSNQTPAKVEGTAETSMTRMAPQAARDQTFRPFITQTPSGNLSQQPLPAMNFVHAGPYNHHNEIAKIVHKVLQPQLPEHPTWTPPSRDYMSKALTCQMCQLMVAEVETVLLCDACEKGYHLKCLQPYNQKVIPRGEWHCPKCLQLSNGKPLPPKYGRVMRNLTSQKAPSIAAGVQSSSEKKIGNSDLKASRQKIKTNGSSSIQSPASSSTISSNRTDLPSNSDIANARGIQGNNLLSSTNNMDEKPSAGTGPNISVKQMGVACPPVGPSVENSTQHIQTSESSKHEEKPAPESKPQCPAELSDTVSNKTDNLQQSNNPQNDDWTALPNCVEIPSKIDNSKVIDSDKSTTTENVDATPTYDAKQDDHDISLSSSSSGARERAGSSSDSLHDVEWTGDVFQVVDEKTFYKSCRVGGVMYKVHDHALFHFSHDKLVPSKLQSMWEDNKTGSKWVIVNRCYFPGDLPDVVGCPPTPEMNEVYESNHDSTVMAGLIQGPCEVLPAAKFKEEVERRSQLDTETNGRSWPVFLCKWFYDELKGNFQPISS